MSPRRRPPHASPVPARAASRARAEYNYDYAGQDPINGYDLDGTRPCTNIVQWLFLPLVCYMAQSGRSTSVTLPTVKTWENSRGELTSGTYTILESRQSLHKNGTRGKSQFGWPDKADQLVLDAAAYADAHNLWRNNRVTLTLTLDIGVSGGHATNKLTISRRNNGYIHGWPSS